MNISFNQNIYEKIALRSQDEISEIIKGIATYPFDKNIESPLWSSIRKELDHQVETSKRRSDGGKKGMKNRWNKNNKKGD